MFFFSSGQMVDLSPVTNRQVVEGLVELGVAALDAGLGKGASPGPSRKGRRWQLTARLRYTNWPLSYLWCSTTWGWSKRVSRRQGRRQMCTSLGARPEIWLAELRQTRLEEGPLPSPFDAR